MKHIFPILLSLPFALFAEQPIRVISGNMATVAGVPLESGPLNLLSIPVEKLRPYGSEAAAYNLTESFPPALYEGARLFYYHPESETYLLWQSEPDGGEGHVWVSKPTIEAGQKNEGETAAEEPAFASGSIVWLELPEGHPETASVRYFCGQETPNTLLEADGYIPLAGKTGEMPGFTLVGFAHKTVSIADLLPPPYPETGVDIGDIRTLYTFILPGSSANHDNTVYYYASGKWFTPSGSGRLQAVTTQALPSGRGAWFVNPHPTISGDGLKTVEK